MTTKKTFGSRKFYALPEDYPLRARKISVTTPQKKSEETSKLIRYIDENVIGKNTSFAGPYGRRKVVYCDYAASGRSLQFLEDYISREVLPCYGNTHTTTSITSLQTTLYRHEARDLIRNAVHASEHDAVIFAGSGCTGAVHKLIHALDLRSQPPPVVFVGPTEHHSNLLPWRELGAKVVRIRETSSGHLDLVELERQLASHAGCGLRLVGCLSAASNVTGVLADDVAATLLLHQYGALAFWDYATAAPYVKLDMNPILPGVDESAVHKDAMFFSVHKFVGGVQTPGVLVAKKSLFANPVPDGCGGGSVFFVSREGHRYLQDVELREEGGTAAVVESVRAGLAIQLKEGVGVPAIMAREHKITRMVLSHVRTIPELVLLGPATSSKRLAVFSFVVRHPRGTFLHHNFVCAVLNDVFGIQVRGGCACAGPYAQDLLGISEDLAREYEDVLMEDRRLDRSHLRRREEHSSFEMLRPGFVRLSFPFFMPDQEVAFVLEALKMVATEGWKLLPQYILNPETAEWRHHSNTVFRERKWLGHIRYADGKMTVSERRVSCLGTFPQDYAECLQTARNIFNKARKMAQRCPLADQCALFDDRTERLRWFVLPSEAQDLLLGHARRVKSRAPFEPPSGAAYPGSGPATTAPPPTPPTSPSPPSPPPEVLPRHASLPCIARTPLRPRPASPATASLPPHRGSGEWGRARCYSLGSAAEEAGSLGRRSCGSQTDLSRASPPSPSPSEDIAAYVHNVTQSLATEIKSEIREVISKVDVLLSDGEGNGCGSSTCGTPPLPPQAPQRVAPPVPVVDMRGTAPEGALEPLSESDTSTSSSAATDSEADSQRVPVTRHPVSGEGGEVTAVEDGGVHSEDRSSGGETADSGINLELAVSLPVAPTAANPTARWHCPPKTIWKPTVEALQEFEMIRDGDRVMVCLSGGKDSLSLLHALRQYQTYASRARGVTFTLGAATVDPGSPAYDPRPLIPYLQALGIHYLYEEQGILAQAAALERCTSVCSFCSRMKRGRLYAAARAHGYNVLALGQHLDDAAESFLMSVFHNGRLRSMKAHYWIRERDLRVIRPFIYVREKALRQFAETRNLPIIPENCPACFEAPKERHRSKQLLAQQEVLFPRLFCSLRAALRPLFSFRHVGEEGRVYGSGSTRRQRRPQLPLESSDSDGEREEDPAAS